MTPSAVGRVSRSIDRHHTYRVRNGSRARRVRRGDERGAISTAPREAGAGTPLIPGYSGLEVIGHGASATVYRGLQEGYDRQVAVKVLNIDISDRRAQKRFQRERALNGRLSDHPNVVTVLDSGFVDGRYPYLAMELFEHGSLADHLRQRGPFDVATALHVGVRIAGALETAHRLGVLHRDVKPQNVLRSRFGEPALADFGIAAILEMEHSLTAALTPVHAAPELLEGADPSERTDVYALASTVYTMLAGSPPFAGPPGEGMLAQLLRITTSDLPALARADVPASLVDVLRAALAKRPEQRTASAADLGRALQRVQGELGLAVTPLPVEGAAEAPVTAEPTVAASPTGAPVTATAPSVSAASASARPVVEAAPLVPPVPLASLGTLPPPLAGTAGDPPLRTPLVAPAEPAPAVPPVVLAVARGAEVAGAEGTIDVPLVDSPTVTARHVVRPAAPPARRRRRWVVPVACAGALVVGVGGAVGVVALTGAAPRDVAAPTSTLAATSTSATLPADLTTLAPTGLGVSTEGGTVLLTWTDHTGGRAPHLVSTFPTALGVPVAPADPGVTSVVVAGLDPDAPACLVVSAVVSLSPSRRVDSAPFCINGAVAQG